MRKLLRAHIEAIVPLTDGEFDVVLGHFSEREAKKGEYLIREGELVPDAFFVISGLLKLIHTDAEGKEYTVAFAMEDWWESDYLAYFTETRASMSLQCLEDTEVYSLSLAAYRELCTRLPKMALFFLEKATRGNIGAQQRILSLITSNARERYQHLLDRYPELLQRVSKAQLATYLGVSRETLSRI